VNTEGKRPLSRRKRRGEQGLDLYVDRIAVRKKLVFYLISCCFEAPYLRTSRTNCLEFSQERIFVLDAVSLCLSVSCRAQYSVQLFANTGAN
jgi:hypothetical protein